MSKLSPDDPESHKGVDVTYQNCDLQSQEGLYVPVRRLLMAGSLAPSMLLVVADPALRWTRSPV
jgi:hypothetical protein